MSKKNSDNDNNDYEFELKPFSYNKINSNDHHTIIVIGSPFSGKTCLARTILSKFKDYPRGIVISKTEHLSPCWRYHVPMSCIYNDYDKDTLTPVIQAQEKAIEQENEEIEIYGKSNKDNRFVIVMDDILTDDSLRHDKNLRTLFVNGRHYKTMLILLLQAPITITPIQRSCISFTCILSQNSKESKKKLFEYYCNCIDDYSDFITIYSKATENKGALVIHNCALTEQANNKLFWTKADPNIQFKAFSEKLWERDKLYKEKRKNNKIKKQVENLNETKEKNKRKDSNVDIRLKTKDEQEV